VPLVKIIQGDEVFEQNVEENTNLVVQAGIKNYPFPYLKYKCGMGTCGTCALKIISGAQDLSEPTWKEIKVLKEKLNSGYRLACQFRVFHDIEIKQ
jgi:ferredoxin